METSIFEFVVGASVFYQVKKVCMHFFYTSMCRNCMQFDCGFERNLQKLSKVL